jgi:hypothetical protein
MSFPHLLPSHWYQHLQAGPILPSSSLIFVNGKKQSFFVLDIYMGSDISMHIFIITQIVSCSLFIYFAVLELECRAFTLEPLC